MKSRRGLVGYITVFMVVAALGIALSIAFGVFNALSSSLNSGNTSYFDTSFLGAVDTSKNFANIGLIILAAVGVIGMVMYLVRVIQGGGA